MFGIKALIKEFYRMTTALDSIRVAVWRNTTVTESAITLLVSIKQALDAAVNAGSMDAVAELARSLDAETDKLAAAVVANTPSSPPPSSPPEQPVESDPEDDDSDHGDEDDSPEGEKTL